MGLERGLARKDGASSWRPTRLKPTLSVNRDAPNRAQEIAHQFNAASQAISTPPPTLKFMAILNLTKDSFSDGGNLLPAGALEETVALRKSEGASWLDLGAESTRPGAEPVAEKDQLDYLLPAIRRILPFKIPISIDTRSAKVAKNCLEAGATMVNDVSGFAYDPAMPELVAEKDCPVVLMHMRGTPSTMNSKDSYADLFGEVADELAQRARAALDAGIRHNRILLDPGIGFAKNAEASRALLNRIGAFKSLGFPLLAGPSRKSCLDPKGLTKPADRDPATFEAAVTCANQGVAILRLHQGKKWAAISKSSLAKEIFT